MLCEPLVGHGCYADEPLFDCTESIAGETANASPLRSPVSFRRFARAIAASQRTLQMVGAVRVGKRSRHRGGGAKTPPAF